MVFFFFFFFLNFLFYFIFFSHLFSLLLLLFFFIGTAKDRKNICSTLKGIVMNAACDELGHRVILALLCFTDDTQLLKKALIDEVCLYIETLIYY